MANFIFNWAETALQNSTLDLSAGNYYAHVVTTAPDATNTTVADLALPTVSGYAPANLTGLSLNLARWTFADFTFPKYVFVTAPIGVVFCKRSGASPAAADQIICYLDFANSIGQTIALIPGSYGINISLGANGAIKFENFYQYSSGVFVDSEPVPKGLIYLIGSNNNTVAFTNPVPSKITILHSVNGLTQPSIYDRTNRTIEAGAVESNVMLALDLGNLKIRVGKFRYRVIAATGSFGSERLYGSNVVPDFPTNGLNTSFYTLLSDLDVLPSNGWMEITCSSQTPYRYLLFQKGNGFAIPEIEFYESTVYSPTLNIV